MIDGVSHPDRGDVKNGRKETRHLRPLTMILLIALALAIAGLFTVKIADDKVTTCWQDLRQGHDDLAISSCGRAAQVSFFSASRISSALTARAGAYYNKRNYDQAIADENRAIELSGDYVLGHRYRAYIYHQKHDYERAIADYTYVIDQHTGYAEDYANRSGAYYSMGKYDQAIADLDQSIKLAPNNPEWLFWRADAHAQKGEDELAIADYDRAIKFNPNYRDAYYKRASVYYKKADYDRAIADYSQAIELLPNDANAFAWRGRAYSEQGNYDLAIADSEKAIQLDHRNALALSNLCFALAVTDLATEALPYCNDALAIDMHDRSFWQNRAYVQIRLQRWSNAELDLATGLSLTAKSKPDPRAMFMLAYIQDRLGHATIAQVNYSVARKADPKIDENMKRIGLVSTRSASGPE